MQGSILFNGNIVFEVDFISRFRNFILSSSHDNESVRNNRTVLLICSAWGGDEYNESHIRKALYKIEIPSIVKNREETNIQNLGAYFEWRNFLEKHKEIGNLYNECLDTIHNVKKFYLEKNMALIELIRNHNARIKQKYPETTLSDILSYNVSGKHKIDPVHLLFHHSCNEIQGTLKALVESDSRQSQICMDVHNYFFRRSRLTSNNEYNRVRKNLIEKILRASSIFILGGSIELLYYSLRFWQLGEVLQTALALGANFYTTSAGSMVLCRDIILYDDFQEDRGHGKREFEFFDHGFGLVTKINLFPHCMERVKTDDPDNLSYLAYRFGKSTCVGLNQESFFHLETYIREGRIYERFQSIGSGDGVYVFDPSGKKIRKDKGEELKLPGTWLWEHPEDE